MTERSSVGYGQTDWVNELRGWHAVFKSTVEIPFVGGLAGLLSYDLGHAFEVLQKPTHNEFELPVLKVGVYDWCIAWDHSHDRCFLVCNGCTKDQTVSEAAMAAREQQVLQTLSGMHRGSTDESASFERGQATVIAARRYDVPAFSGITSNFAPDGYKTAVDRVREHIAAGDIFQANLAQRLLAPQTEHSIDLYRRLRQVNPAPLAGYFDAGPWQILSASPERFLEVTAEGQVETRPIKGTRPRGLGVEADLFTRDELRESDKDVAENVMIVDLLRNDLSCVCDPATLTVPQLCEIETYETVQHLVSSVRATLDADCDVWDLISAAFPGGSITGCPKIRAMDVITEVEQVARGPYCGSLFYHSFSGRFDASILIRTMIAAGGWIQMSVGGGITYASDPADEYQETIDKAVGLIRALKRRTV